MRLGDRSGGELGSWGASRGDVDKVSNGQTEVAAESATEAEARMARLVRTIEGEIVPRLVMARRVVRVTVPVENAARGPDDVDVKELVRVLLAHDVSVASAYVETVRQRGASLEAVCLRLLAPAARELGLLWEEDECDFMQVTVGLCRLHHLLRELSPEFRPETAERKVERNILLAPVPGDQHTFGVTLVAQFLRQAGWEVWHEFPTSQGEILDIVRQTWFTVVGLSVGSETRVDEMSATIRAIRQASRNSTVGILVGGPLLVARPELASLMGADATAVDGPMAVQRAEHICTWQNAVTGSLRNEGGFL
jgi:MerR family transcriptional regulator, light-induced transcriptional regulator